MIASGAVEVAGCAIGTATCAVCATAGPPGTMTADPSDAGGVGMSIVSGTAAATGAGGGGAAIVVAGTVMRLVRRAAPSRSAFSRMFWMRLIFVSLRYRL